MPPVEVHPRLRHRAHRLLIVAAVAAISASAGVTLTALAVPASAVEAGTATRSISTAGTAVTENFDSLASTGTSTALPAGARFDETGTSAAADGKYTAGTGSSNAGDIYSFGASGSSERALGEIRSGTLVPLLGHVYTNDTGSTIASLAVSYTGEQWRLGTAGRTAGDGLTFAYRVGATSVDDTGTFTNVTALNYTAPTTGTVGAVDGNTVRSTQSATISGLSIPAGATVLFRWTDIDATGADDGLGIDDLSTTATTAGGATADQPITPSCGSGIATNQGTAASQAISATDPDSSVNGASITSAAVSGITLDNVAPATANGGTLTGTLNVATTTAAGIYSVVIGFTNNTGQTASCTVMVTVSGLLKIDQIQGAGFLSPYAGADQAAGSQTVTTQGVVTGVGPNGYYIEDPTPDSNPLTSEGVYVFTGAGGGKPTAGQSVQVSGKVAEFRRGGGNDLSQTEITGTPTFSVLSSPLPSLPAPVVLGPGALQAPAQVIDADHPEGSTPTNIETDGHTLNPSVNAADFYETYEDMRVTLTGAVAVGPTATAFGEIPVLPASPAGDPGPGQTQTFRGGVLYSSYSTMNTRRVVLDDEDYKSGSTPAAPAVNVGAVLGGNLSGVLTYDFDNPYLELNAAPSVVSNTLARTNAPAASPGDFSIGSLNVENLSAANSQSPPSKFAALAGQIVTGLGSPDVVNVQEIQDNDGAPDYGGKDDGVVDASDTYNRLIAAIGAAGGPTYSYVQIDPVNKADGGDPGGNIRQGLLFRTDTGLTLATAPAGDSTTADSVTTGSDGAPHLALNPGRVMPNDNAAWTASRKPLAVELIKNGRSFFVIDNHFISKGGDDPLFGRIQPPNRSSETQRQKQADDVNTFVKSILAVDPNADVAVVGDLNDYSFSPALAHLEAGNVLTDLITRLPANQQYNYVFQGNSQQLDHTLVSPHLLRTTNPSLSVARQNSEFNDQVSDHEPEVVRLSFATASASLPEAPAAVLLLVTGLAAGGAVVIRRRRRASASARSPGA